VIRTAAHAAWAVPVISAVSAAPAFAVSPKLTVTAQATIRTTSAGAGVNAGFDVTCTLTLTVVGTSTPPVATFILNVPAAYGGLTKKPDPAVAPAASWELIQPENPLTARGPSSVSSVTYAFRVKTNPTGQNPGLQLQVQVNPSIAVDAPTTVAVADVV
jgi:hypothetical protein